METGSKWVQNRWGRWKPNTLKPPPDNQSIEREAFQNISDLIPGSRRSLSAAWPGWVTGLHWAWNDTTELLLGHQAGILLITGLGASPLGGQIAAVVKRVRLLCLFLWFQILRKICKGLTWFFGRIPYWLMDLYHHCFSMYVYRILFGSTLKGWAARFTMSMVQGQPHFAQLIFATKLPTSLRILSFSWFIGCHPHSAAVCSSSLRPTTTSPLDIFF